MFALYIPLLHVYVAYICCMRILISFRSCMCI